MGGDEEAEEEFEDLSTLGSYGKAGEDEVEDEKEGW
jgi:hypothetical protein